MESPLSRAVLRDGLALHFMSLGGQAFSRTGKSWNMAGEDGGREADAGRGRRRRVKGISFRPATDVVSPPADAGEASPASVGRVLFAYFACFAGNFNRTAVKLTI